jgi:hypothetical protein
MANRISPIASPSATHGAGEIIAAIENLGTKIETSVKSDATTTWAYIKANHVHYLGYGSIVGSMWAIAKHLL